MLLSSSIVFFKMFSLPTNNTLYVISGGDPRVALWMPVMVMMVDGDDYNDDDDGIIGGQWSCRPEVSTCWALSAQFLKLDGGSFVFAAISCLSGENYIYGASSMSRFLFNIQLSSDGNQTKINWAKFIWYDREENGEFRIWWTIFCEDIIVKRKILVDNLWWWKFDNFGEDNEHTLGFCLCHQKMTPNVICSVLNWTKQNYAKLLRIISTVSMHEIS